MALRPTLILHHAKQVYSRHGNLLQPRALADAVDGELLLNVSSRILLQHCLVLFVRKRLVERWGLKVWVMMKKT